MSGRKRVTDRIGPAGNHGTGGAVKAQVVGEVSYVST